MRGTLRILRTRGLAFALGVAAASAATITIVSPVAHAQDFRGTISGKISDSSGGRLPGATVTATNIATNVGSSTTTASARRLHDFVSRAREVHRDGGALRIQEADPAGHRGPRRRSPHAGSLARGRPRRGNRVGHRRDAAARDRQRVGGPGDRREAHRAAAAVGRQPVRALAARARRRLHRRAEVLATLRQRRHLRHQRGWFDRRQRVLARRIAEHGATAGAWRSSRPLARCRSSRSKRRASMPQTATPPARWSTSR